MFQKNVHTLLIFYNITGNILSKFSYTKFSERHYVHFKFMIKLSLIDKSINTKTTEFKIYLLGVPIMAQQKRIWLVTIRLWVWSLASLNRLRIWHCPELCCKSQMRLGSGIVVTVVQAGSCSSDSTPRLGTSICHRCGPKKDKIIRRRRRRAVFQKALIIL